MRLEANDARDGTALRLCRRGIAAVSRDELVVEPTQIPLAGFPWTGDSLVVSESRLQKYEGRKRRVVEKQTAHEVRASGTVKLGLSPSAKAEVLTARVTVSTENLISLNSFFVRGLRP